MPSRPLPELIHERPGRIRRNRGSVDVDVLVRLIRGFQVQPEERCLTGAEFDPPVDHVPVTFQAHREDRLVDGFHPFHLYLAEVRDLGFGFAFEFPDGGLHELVGGLTGDSHGLSDLFERVAVASEFDGLPAAFGVPDSAWLGLFRASSHRLVAPCCQGLITGSDL